MNRSDAYALVCEYTASESLRKHALAVGCGSICIENHIAYVVIGLVILRGDVDRVTREHFVQAPEHAWQIALHLDEARARGPRAAGRPSSHDGPTCLDRGNGVRGTADHDRRDAPQYRKGVALVVLVEAGKEVGHDLEGRRREHLVGEVDDLVGNRPAER